MLGGAIQFLGILKAGVIGYYFPSSVIKGMLTGIGLIIFIKQIPLFLGIDKSIAGGFMEQVSPGATAIAVVSMGILLLWEAVTGEKSQNFPTYSRPLVAVAVGIIYTIVTAGNPQWGISSAQLVGIPEDIANLSFVTLPTLQPSPILKFGL